MLVQIILSTNDSPEMIADKIIETAESIKKEDNNVVLSAIVPRGNKLNEKAEKVNSLLEKACNQKQIDLIMHSNINTKRHLNRSRLHLNGYGKSIVIRNIRNYLTNFNPLSAKFIKWSNTLKQIVGKLPTICLSVFDHFSGLALKGLSDRICGITQVLSLVRFL